MPRCKDALNEVPRESDPEEKLFNANPSSLRLTQRAGRFADNSIREARRTVMRLEIILLPNEGKERQTNRVAAGVVSVRQVM